MKANIKSFLSSLLVIFILMITCYILTFIIPGGEYARTVDADGNVILDTAVGFSYVQGGIPFWKWILSPFLILGSDGNVTLLAIIAFLLIIGGIFEILNRFNLISYLLSFLTSKFGNKKYVLMAVLIFFFMFMGSFIGSFEEMVPLVPIVVALSISFGWDVFTGISMSLVACGCGFAAGVMNPFTIGVAQRLVGLQMFSGIWLRIVSFVLIYALLFAFTYFYAKKIEKPVDPEKMKFERDSKMSRAIIAFASILLIGIVLIILSAFVKALQDYTMIIVAVMFLVAGIVAAIFMQVGLKAFFKGFFSGLLGILPAVLMILMASSIKYTLTEAHILDTIIYGAMNVANNIPKFLIILFIYLIVLVMNFFIASGSAKAFLLVPIIVEIAGVFGISPQLCILAFAFGDGFSNVFYPTNPVLLITLGLNNVEYGKFAKHNWKFQLSNLVLTSGILLFGLLVGY